jgi:hypothetical protein
MAGLDPAIHEAKKRPGAIPALLIILSSSSAKADDPVLRGLSILSLAAAITGCPLSRA